MYRREVLATLAGAGAVGCTGSPSTRAATPAPGEALTWTEPEAVDFPTDIPIASTTFENSGPRAIDTLGIELRWLSGDTIVDTTADVTGVNGFIPTDRPATSFYRSLEAETPDDYQIINETWGYVPPRTDAVSARVESQEGLGGTVVASNGSDTEQTVLLCAALVDADGTALHTGGKQVTIPPGKRAQHRIRVPIRGLVDRIEKVDPYVFRVPE